MVKSVMILIITWFLFFCQADSALAGSQIIINKTTNQLHFLQDGDVVRTFPVATGRHPTYTPEGNFSVVVKLVNPYYTKLGIPGGSPRNPLGVRWLGLSIGGGGVYGVHGTNNPSSIGTYASAGCIRMHNRDVIWLYQHTPVGTPVQIITAQAVTKPVPQPEPVTVVFGEHRAAINNPVNNGDGQPLLPLRNVFELLGYGVTWDAGTSRVNLRRGTQIITVDYLTRQVTTGGAVSEGLEIKIIGGTAYGPISLWQKTLTNIDVRWDQETRTLTFTSVLDDYPILWVNQNGAGPPPGPNASQP